MNIKQNKLNIFKFLSVFVFALLAFSFVLSGFNSKIADASSNSSELNFQARLLTAAGAPVPNGSYNLDFKLYSTLSTGGGQAVGTCTNTGGYDCLWEETYTSTNVVLVTNGYFTVYLGSITAFPSTIDWEQPLWLTINVGGTGAPSWNGEMSPRIEAPAFPYAFNATQLANNGGGNRQVLNFGSDTGSDTITLPDASGTVCLNAATACDFLTGIGGSSGTGVQLQATTPGTAQTGNFYVTGTGIAGSVEILSSSSDSIDTYGSGVLSIGNTNATGITLGASTTISANKSLTVDGSTTIEDATNSATAVQIQNASGSDVLNANTTTGGSAINLNFLSPPATILPTLAPVAPTITHSGTAGTTSYTYEVVAVDANGAQTVNSPTGNTTTGNAILSATNYNIISWTAPTDTPVNYLIYRTATGTGAYPNTTGLIGSTIYTAFDDTGLTASQSVPSTTGTLTNGTKYYFKVTALDSTGGQTTPSAELDGTSGATNTVATTGTNLAITLSWAPVTGARGYNVYYGTSSGGENDYVTTYTNSYTLTSTTPTGYTTGSPPSTNTAYDDSLSNTTSTTTASNSQITLGNLAGSSSSAQLDVAGSIPVNYVGLVNNIGSSTVIAGVAIQGNYAYETNYSSSSLTIVDISNPANPVVVSSTTAGLDDPENVVVQGNYAYIDNFGNSSLVIDNISNPSSPVEVGSITSGLSGPISVVVQGNYAYTDNSTGNSLVIDNISNPANPVEVGSISGLFPANGPDAITVSGNYAYLTNYSSSNSYLAVFNISNPSSPVEVNLTSNGLLWPVSVSISGSYAYVTEYDAPQLVIFNISNPANPVLISSISSGSLSRAYSVAISGHYAYMTSHGNGTINILDISNPADPIIIGSFGSVLPGPYYVVIQGRYAYVANGGTTASLVIFDLGGTYTQSLQAGSLETTTLQVDGSANISGSETISGGVTVGQSVEVDGSLSLNGNLADGNALTTTDLPTPDAPTVTPIMATAGSTTYSYQVAAVASNGSTSAASAAGTVTTGNATLSTTNYNVIGFTPIQGAASYSIYRTAGGAAQGLIGTISGSSLTPVTSTAASGTTTQTLTFSSNPFIAGQIVTLTGYSPAQDNITGVVLTATTTQITIAVPGGGTVTVEGTVTGQFNLADTGLTATATTAPTEDSSATIDIEALAAPGTVSTTIAPAAPTFGYDGTTGSTHYTYEVVAVDANGAQTLPSATATATTGNAILSNTNMITLAITAVPGATDYLVYRTAAGAGGYPNSTGLICTVLSQYSGICDDAGFPASAPVPPTTTTGNLNASTTYYFKVTALDSTGGQTLPSAQVSKATGSIASQEAITLSWAPVSGARGYNVYYGTSSGGENEYVTTTANSYTLTSTTPTGYTAGSPPITDTSNDDSLSSSNNSQITLGNVTNSASSAQLDVAGTFPTSAVGSVTTGTVPYALTVNGNYAYVVNQTANDMQIIDISNPTSPVVVSTITTGEYPESVEIAGHYAYIANNYGATMQIIDISNPTSPVLVSTVATLGDPYGIFVQGNYAYVEIGSAISDLQIFNVINPANPVSVGSTVTGEYSYSVFVQGEYAYIGEAGSGNIGIVNVANPAAPYLVDYWGVGNTDTNPSFMYVQGDYAYVAEHGEPYMQIVNIANPVNPYFTGQVATGTTPLSVFVYGHYAYVTNSGSNNFQIIDVSNPYDPVIVDTVSTGTSSAPDFINVQGNYAYVADSGTNALQVFNLGGTYTQSLQTGSLQTTTLQVDGSANVSGSESITGSLNVGQSEAISGSLSLNGNITDGGILSTTDLDTPSDPTVNPVMATAGTTTYSYAVAAVASNGTTSASSGVGTTAVGNATLSTTNYNVIGISPVQGAASYNIYRTAGGAAQGLIGNIKSTSLSPFTPTAASGTTTLTLTIAAQPFVVGQIVYLSGFSPAADNTNAIITATATNTITVTIPGGATVTTEGTVMGFPELADTGLTATATSTAPTVDSSGSLNVTGSMLLETTYNSTSAFVISNSYNTPILVVDTSGNNSNGVLQNYLSNPGFENGTTSWAGVTGVISQNTAAADVYDGQKSLELAQTTTGVVDTTGFRSTPAAGQYTVSFFVLPSATGPTGGNFSVTLTASTTNGTCTVAAPAPTGTLSTTGFTRLYCTTTAFVGTLTNLEITDAYSGNVDIYIDSVEMTAGTTLYPYAVGNIQLRGLVDTPLNIESYTNSTNLLSVYNATGTQMLDVDTLDGLVDIGTGANGDTTGYSLVLDNKTNTGDPSTATTGAMYYNSYTGNFRCAQAGEWQNCLGGTLYSNNAITTFSAVTGCTTACTSLNAAAPLALPANYCTTTTNRVIHIHAAGVYTTAASSTVSMGVYMGTSATKASDTVVGAASGALSSGAAVTSQNWVMDFYITCQSTANKVYGEGNFVMATSSTANAAGGLMYATTTSSETLTSAIDVYLFPTVSATGVSVQLNQLVISSN